MARTFTTEAPSQCSSALPRYYTPEEVAASLAVPADSVRKWCRKGTLRAVKAGRLVRISEEAVREFLAGQGDGQ